MARRIRRSALYTALTANDGRRTAGGRPAADLERPRSGRTGRPGRAFTCRTPGRYSRGWWGRPLRLYSSGPPRRAALTGSLPLAGAALRALRGTATRPRLLTGGPDAAARDSHVPAVAGIIFRGSSAVGRGMPLPRSETVPTAFSLVPCFIVAMLVIQVWTIVGTVRKISSVHEWRQEEHQTQATRKISGGS